MTVWTARLGNDGRTVLCGRTVAGRTKCPGTFGHVVVNEDGSREVIFNATYRLATETPRTLTLTNYAATKRDKGDKPRPRRPTFAAPDWALQSGPVYLAHSSKEWPLPVIARCQRGHVNEVTDRVLASPPPSR